MIDYLMQQLCKELQLDTPLKPQSKGVYVIPLGDDLEIKVTALPIQGVMLSATLCAIPEYHEDQYFENILRANLFGTDTHGAVLGINAEGGMVTLTHTADYRIDYNEFRNIVEDFINTADFWIDEANEISNNPKGTH